MAERLERLEPWQNPNERPYIQIDNVSKKFPSGVAVNHISLSVYQKEFFCLLGGSGCGKTTLLRMLAGFETPSAGHILIDGVDMSSIPPYQRPVNMMFQSYALFPHMNVGQNVAFGLEQERLPRAVIEDRVRESLDLVQMRGYEARKPHQLSGGQQQRVALARSLAKQPKLLLLDEPLAALDKKLRERTQFELVNIQERVGITFIMVTHDQEEAMTIASRIGIMHEGRLCQVGTPHEIYEYPHSRYVANFIGSMNLFDGIVTADERNHVTVESAEAGCDLHVRHSTTLPLGSSVSVAIRPEKMMISLTPVSYKHNVTQGVVREIGYLGDVSIYHVALDSGKIVMATSTNLVRVAERPVNWDDRVYLHWKSENGLILTT